MFKVWTNQSRIFYVGPGLLIPHVHIMVRRLSRSNFITAKAFPIENTEGKMLKLPA